MYEGRDEIAIMQDDLKRALAKVSGGSDPNWSMIIDTRRCMLCHSCTVGCMAEHKSPPRIRYRPVYEAEGGSYPAVSRTFVPRPCMHCETPACVNVCPHNPDRDPEKTATWKETEGLGKGIVMINYNNCVGCRRCIPACPYGARNRDPVDSDVGGSTNATVYHADNAPYVPPMEKGPAYEYGAAWTRTEGTSAPAPVKKVRKCHFCFNRLKNEMLPVCVSTCIGRATYFGDLSDASSLVSKIASANQTVEMSGVGEFQALAWDIFNRVPPPGSASVTISTDERLQAMAAYPGKTPEFGTPFTQPRVKYIL